MAPEAKLLPIRVSHSAGPIDSEQVFSAGIRYATDHGAKVINISLAADADQEIDECPTLVKRAIADAIQHDVVIVAAAGDEGDAANAPEYPASCPGVLAVGAIDKYAEPWKSTQRQSYVTVAAPGVHVGWVGQSGKYYPNGWGSSQASALTAAWSGPDPFGQPADVRSRGRPAHHRDGQGCRRPRQGQRDGLRGHPDLPRDDEERVSGCGERAEPGL